MVAQVRGQWTIPTRVGRTPDPEDPRGRHQDHPHAGGENRLREYARARAAGPSPRGWGEHLGAPRAGILTRTIPTRVGRT